MQDIPVRKGNANSNESIFAIKNVKKMLSGKSMTQSLHRHDFFFLLALEQGTGFHEIDFVPYNVCARTIFFIRPGQVHQLTLNEKCTGYLLNFNANSYVAHDKVKAELLRKISGVNFYQLDIDDFKKSLSILDAIFQEFTNKDDGYREVINANLSILLTELSRNIGTDHKGGGTPYSQERLEEFLELLETHSITCKRAAQYAEMMNLSLYQLNAVTKSTVGKTCSELINEYMILEAKRYLLTTSNQISSIAYDLGYDDTSYFIRFFKKHMKCSPKVFRHKFF
ncbi:AraC family transcriptional regulator [Aquimarina sp. MAR_2010_214]|uniref:AraC family transcriptional regulator n=1 Tax=Aquimarina sp. MAR_2010_214 TaxID=1250026 RepID=UPI000C70CCF0|nr:helix-turn-helix transcriptional regulator [Aquimarina sp. MAR_2010_214]PKV52750.1 AraC family transcriptional regulator [Aquimarina sp. MAR_2010_214]